MWQGMRLVVLGSSLVGGSSALPSQRVLQDPEHLGCDRRHLRVAVGFSRTL